MRLLLLLLVESAETDFCVFVLFQCGEGPASGTGKAGPGSDVLVGRREGSGPSGWRGSPSVRGACQSKFSYSFFCAD